MTSVAYLCVISALILQITFLVSVTEGGRYDPKDGRHNITHGERKYGDRLLFRDNPVQKGKWLRVISTDVNYPPNGQRKNTTVITFFKITDRMPKGNEGYAFINNGGVGRTYLSVHLKSQRSEGYNFTVEIYGFSLNI